MLVLPIHQKSGKQIHLELYDYLLYSPRRSSRRNWPPICAWPVGHWTNNDYTAGCANVDIFLPAPIQPTSWLTPGSPCQPDSGGQCSRLAILAGSGYPSAPAHGGRLSPAAGRPPGGRRMENGRMEDGWRPRVDGELSKSEGVLFHWWSFSSKRMIDYSRVTQT